MWEGEAALLQSHSGSGFKAPDLKTYSNWLPGLGLLTCGRVPSLYISRPDYSEINKFCGDFVFPMIHPHLQEELIDRSP